MNIDEMIAQALKEDFEERVEQCAADTKKHHFSLAYRIWKHKTLNDLRKNKSNKHWTLGKARYAVAAMIAAFSLLTCTVVFAAVVIGRYSFDKKSDYSKVFVENLRSDKTSFEEYYGLSEENGWELTNSETGNFSTLLSYENSGKKVTFIQRIIRSGNMGNVNTENAVPQPISIFEDNDGFALVFSESECAVYWVLDGYFFSLNGNITKDEAMNLALSTKIQSF